MILKLSKFHHNYWTFTSRKKKKIFLIPSQPLTFFFYQLHYPQMWGSEQPTAVDSFYTSSRESSRRERRESLLRKSSIWRPNNLCLMNVDSVTFIVSKLCSWRSNARCCLFAYKSAIVNMTQSRVKITAISDNWSGTRSTWDWDGCLLWMNSLIFLAHSLWSSARKFEWCVSTSMSTPVSTVVILLPIWNRTTQLAWPRWNVSE